MGKAVLAISAIALATSANSFAQTPSQETNPVLSLTHQAQLERDAKSKDQFAATPSHADMIGKPFTLVIAGDGHNITSFLDFYNDGVLTMSLSKQNFYYNRPNASMGVATMTAHVPSFQISRDEKKRSNYVGQNSYGAKADVTFSVNEVNYIAAFELPRGEVRSIGGYTINDPDLEQYEWKKTLDGPEAKAIYQGSKLVIEGEIASFPDGKVTRCETSAGTPTVSEPYEYLNYECYVATKVRRIAFVSGDGSVLKEWSGATKASLPKGVGQPPVPATASSRTFEGGSVAPSGRTVLFASMTKSTLHEKLITRCHDRRFKVEDNTPDLVVCSGSYALGLGRVFFRFTLSESGADTKVVAGVYTASGDDLDTSRTMQQTLATLTAMGGTPIEVR